MSTEIEDPFDTGEQVFFRVGDRGKVDAWGRPAEDDGEDDEAPYSTWSNKELTAEVKRRKLVPDGKTKAAFVAALEADDASSDEDDDGE